MLIATFAAAQQKLRLPEPERREDVTCQVVDALGNMIPSAEVIVRERTGEKALGPPLRLVSDDRGVFPLSRSERHPTLVGTLSHPDFGLAEAEFDESAAGVLRLRVPLAKRGSDAGARALRGVIQDPDGKPAVGAHVTCGEARTPGEGLINPVLRQAAITDDQGRFSYYAVDDKRGVERGLFIPPNTRFSICVETGDESLFPYLAQHTNAREAQITLQRPTRQHVLRYEGLGGGTLDGADLETVRLAYQPADNRALRRTLPTRYRDGGALPDGVYIASWSSPTIDGEHCEYTPLSIDAKSPREIVFRRPAAVNFTGRVVNGVTGKPMKDVTITNERPEGLAMLSAADIETLPGVRTDADGKFNFIQPGGTSNLSLLVLADGFLPFDLGLRKVKPQANNIAKLDEVRMFAAATVLVEPVFAGEDSVSVSPLWVIEKNGQPDWFDKFAAASVNQGNGENEFEYNEWLEVNQRQLLFVPAGVKLKLRFETPYQEHWVARASDQVIQLAAGKQLDLGKVTFDRALPIRVKVVDDKDNGVEGVPVSRGFGEAGRMTWGVAHNTNAEGIATFFVPAKVPAMFRISVPKPDKTRERITGDMKPATTAPGAPAVVLRLSSQQIDRVRGK